MAQVDHYELLMKVIANVESARWKDTPMNELAFVWKEGYENAIDNAISEIRKEL